MINVTVMYPSGEGKTFDMEYYLSAHFSLVREVFGDALKAIRIDRGLSGPFPGSTPPYMVICHLTFDCAESFAALMMPNAARIMEDLPNFTNAPPTIQISEAVQ
ncbi:MAG: EthD family reductase [Bryobacterales bacterium]|nr:EthD family reductase [Bryobacterales bacterium]